MAASDSKSGREQTDRSRVNRRRVSKCVADAGHACLLYEQFDLRRKLRYHFHAVSSSDKLRRAMQIVRLHERPVALHEGTIELYRRLLRRRQQRLVFYTLDLGPEGLPGFVNGIDRRQEVERRRGESLGTGDRALVRDRRRERRAGRPMMEGRHAEYCRETRRGPSARPRIRRRNRWMP